MKPSDTANFDTLLARFEDSWRQGPPPRLEAFLPANGKDSRALLIELVLIDLNYRWRLPATQAAGWIDWNSGPAVGMAANAPAQRLLLEDYARQFPALGALDQLQADVIGEEYRVRRRWGDRPGHDTYLARFPRQAGALKPLLAAIDKELAAERSEGIPIATPVAGEPAAKTPGGPITSVEAFLEALRRTRLLGTGQLDQLILDDIRKRFSEPRALAKELLQRGWLTAYQVNQLFMGREADLVIGSYVVLESLGEGGTGRVFKARHQGLDRVVALKLIRKELLTDPEVVSRFYREMQMVSKLASPHVVHAFDAGPAGPTHYLVMEYVEGTNLGRLVKQSGPLPVALAADYIRQAALGLQHIYENQLVHRDIKPGNLVVASGGGKGIVKILDLGLARCRPPGLGQAETVVGEEHSSSTLTPAGSVMMGTPDYLAPEQALDFHAADIRADLYSLGCTFYFLLTGQPPFPGGALAKKLLNHQQLPPPPIEQFRRDLPANLARVVHRLLAKRPEDRYATPADLVADLEAAKDGRPQTDAVRTMPRRMPWRLIGACVVLGVMAVLAFILLGPVFRRPASPSSQALPLPVAKPVSYSLWDDRVTPALPTHSDTSAVELGVRFRTDVPGHITGLRFYKPPGNTGVHLGHLWDRDGKLLAKLTFTNETLSGWQKANFAVPVAIQANSVYTASYHTTVGSYAAENHFFAGKGVDRGPLHALADGVAGNNGVFNPGGSEFPKQTHQATNYWVDVVFTPQQPAKPAVKPE